MIVVFIVYPSNRHVHAGNTCLVPANTKGMGIPFRSDVCPSLPSGTQAIVTSYKFQCYGQIHGWHTYIRPVSDQETNVTRTISFQVWRPSSTVSVDGCYGLVGENIFLDVTAAKDGLVSMMPSRCTVIKVAPGDVVGYFTELNGTTSTICTRNSTEIKLDVSYTEESIWYHTNTREEPLVNSGSTICPFPVGPESDKTLRSHMRAAPMLSVDIGESIVWGEMHDHLLNSSLMLSIHSRHYLNSHKVI